MAERVLPEILAGPIVRRVEARTCSVWIALRDPSDAVKLTVWRGLQTAGAAGGQVASGNAPAGSATVATRQFGRKLHIALATIPFTAPLPPLEPGAVYAYDLQVGDQGLKQLGLLQDDPASQALALGYETDRLPTDDERIAAFDLMTRSAEALQRLKPQELRALLLKAEGHSYAEIGRITGWSYTGASSPTPSSWVGARWSRCS